MSDDDDEVEVEVDVDEPLMTTVPPPRPVDKDSSDSEDDLPLTRRRPGGKKVVVSRKRPVDSDSEDDLPLTRRGRTHARTEGASSAAGSSMGVCANGFVIDIEQLKQGGGENLCIKMVEAKLCAEMRARVRHILQERYAHVPDIFKFPFRQHVINELPEVYDQIFFQNTLRSAMQQQGCSLTMCWKNKCKSSAALCRINGKKRCGTLPTPMTIEFSLPVFTEANECLQRNERVKTNGFECKTILDCILYTFEHELVHALIYCFCVRHGRSNTGPGLQVRDALGYVIRPSASDGHSKTFLGMMYSLFGHTGFRHNFFGVSDAADKNFRVGDKVVVRFKGERQCKGQVIKVYKRRLKVRFVAQQGLPEWEQLIPRGNVILPP